MFKKRIFCLTLCLAMTTFFCCSAAAQEKTPAPQLSVAGVKLGDRETAKTFLGNFQPRVAEDGRPTYYFYNSGGTQVIKLTGASFDDRFFIVEIEVYRVGKSYQSPHFVAEKFQYFMTEEKIFVGYKESKASLITGIPNVDGKDEVGPQAIIKKIGEPTERVKNEEVETFVYNVPDLELTSEDPEKKTSKFDYTARYEFSKNKLRRFILKISL